ncbi:MAG TPA: AsmA family protein [Casimicrobiaceae bacterium]|nr:AsmA family protein [Casimicrobiaceae bacterium]
MRLFWRILAAIGGVLVVLIIAVAIAVRTIDVNDFIAPIQKSVKDATGRDLVIRGGIDFKLSLEPELLIDDVSLSNAEWGKSAQMLTAKRVEAQVKLLPLLQRRFEIVRFKLIDPVIALETDAGGKGNWEFSSAGSGGAAPSSAGSFNAFTIGDLAVDHGALSFHDGESGKTTNIAIDALSLHARDAESPVSARFRGTIGDIAVAMEGDLGPLQALAQRHWPYPVSLKGQVNGQSASVTTNVRVEERTVNFDELQIGADHDTIKGKLALTPGKPRSKLTFKLAATTFAWTDLPLARKLAGAKGAVAHEKFVFNDEALDFGALQASDADGDVSIDTLLLPAGWRLENVRVQFALRNGKLDAPVLQASGFGGSARGRLSIDAAKVHDPALTLHLEAKALDAGAMLAIFGVKREVRGGKTEVTLDIAAHGESPRQWVYAMNGNATVVVGPATLVHTRLDLESPLNRLADAVNPYHRVDPSTELECAVGRLPLKDGIAQIDRSIALETKKFGASASGTVNFRDETLDLAIKPQIRQGIPIDVPQVSSLVRFQGPLRSPSVHVDAVESAAAAAKVGAAIYSGGLSIVAESLLSATTRAGPGPCRTALGQGGAIPNPSAQPSPSSPSRPPESIGKALGRILGR